MAITPPCQGGDGSSILLARSEWGHSSMAERRSPKPIIEVQVLVTPPYATARKGRKVDVCVDNDEKFLEKI